MHRRRQLRDGLQPLPFRVLLKEHLGLDTIRRAYDHEGPVLDVRQEAVGDSIKVPDDVRFREASRWIDDARSVGDCRSAARA